MRSRWLIAVATVALVAVAASAVVLLTGGQDPSPTTAAATPAPVPGAIAAADVTPHLRALEGAVREGTRAAGTPGDAATRAHVVAALRAAGWRVTVQPVRFPYFDERRPPTGDGRRGRAPPRPGRAHPRLLGRRARVRRGA